MQQTLTSHDTLRRTVRISSTGLLWLAVAAPTMFSTPDCSPALADVSKTLNSSGGSPKSAAANHPPLTTPTTGIGESGRIALAHPLQENGSVPLPNALMERLVAGIARRVQASNSEVTSGGVVAQYLSNRSRVSQVNCNQTRRLRLDEREEFNPPSPNPAYCGRFAVLLDNRIVSALSLDSVIGLTGILERNFTHRNIDETVAIEKVGSLPVLVKKNLLSEFTVVPRAGPKTAPGGKSP